MARVDVLREVKTGDVGERQLCLHGVVTGIAAWSHTAPGGKLLVWRFLARCPGLDEHSMFFSEVDPIVKNRPNKK
jgi:hypothetical protein